jgi:hypothetical protein
MKKFLSLINNSMEGNRSWRKDKLFTLKYILYFVFFFVSWMILVDTAVDEIPITEFLMYAFGIMTAVVGTVYCAKPSLLRLAPISYKKRVLYYYASIFIFSVIALAVIICCLAIIAASIIIGNYIDGDTDGIVEMFMFTTSLGVKEYLFSVFKALFTVSLVSIASRMEKKRDIIIAFVVLFVAHFGGTLLLNGLIATSGYGFVFSGNIYPNFEMLPDPTLAVILCGVFAAIAFACSVVFIVYKERPKRG